MVFTAALAITGTASGESGLCAVGEVSGGKAAILKADGTVSTVTVTGSAPEQDTVCWYSEADGEYSFTPVTFAGYNTWRIYDVNGGSIFYGSDGVNEYRVSYADAVAFLKTGTHKWKVATSNQVVIAEGVGDYPNTYYPANIDAADIDGNGTLDVMYADGTATYNSGHDHRRH